MTMDAQFSTYYTKIQGHEVEIYEDATIIIEVDCCCGHTVELAVTANDLVELARQAKMFRDRRTVYMVKKKAKTS